MTLLFPKNVAGLAQVAAPESERYSMSCLRVIWCQDDWYRVEATDGKRLAIVCGPPQQPGVPLPAMEHAGEVGEVLVPAADWRAAFRQAGKGGVVGLAATADAITLATSKTLLRCQPGEGRWPDVAHVLPRTPPLVSFAVNPELLASLCQLAGAVCDPGGMHLDVLYYGPGKPIGLMARNDSGQTLDCILMPLT